MKITKKLSAAFLAFALTMTSFMVCALKGTTPGYKMVNTYNEDEGTVTSVFYVSGGYGAVGQVGIFYDTDLLELCAKVDGEYTTEYTKSGLSISAFVQANKDNDVTVTAERNDVEDLIDDKNGEVYFAWYTGIEANLDATDEDQSFAKIKFALADGVTVEDLEDAGEDLIKFATRPSKNSDIVGYRAGARCENEEAEAFMNASDAKNRITLSVEFEGLDIEVAETVVIRVVDKNGKPVEGAYVKIGKKEYVTDKNGQVTVEVSGDYVVYYKYLKDDKYQSLELGETTVKLTAPGKPEDLELTRGTEKITVEWSEPSSNGGSKITKYIVSYTPSTGGESTKEVNGDKTRCVLEDLTGGTEYSIKVKAVNALGEGEYCAVQKATPKAEESGGGAGGGGGGGGGAAAPEVTSFTVTYEPTANGTITSGSKTEAVKSGNKPAKVPTIKAAEGFEFIGWATKDGTMVDPTTVVIKEATTFYAQYKRLAAPVTVSFVDVKAGTYYEAPVQWAVNKGITTGTSSTTFSPDSTCTRAQAVTFLWRAAGSPAPKNSEMVFTDVPTGSYYYDAVLWAVENGITNGTSATTFSPDNTCIRAQIVTFLGRSQKASAANTANPFTDVAASQYYTNAVLWAVEKGITTGTSATTFSPDNDCTRAQIVTFLYRCLADVK